MSTTTDVRLKARYKSEIQPTLKSEFGYTESNADSYTRQDCCQHGCW